MNKVLLLIISFYSLNLFSQDISENTLKEYEDTLSQIANNIMHGETETFRRESNLGFISELKEILKYKPSYLYPFDSLITISILSPYDKSFRIFNWILKKENGEYEYFGIIILPPKENDKYNTLVELKDNSQQIINPEEKILDQNNWYGSLYYNIISTKKKNAYYTLLGWDGNNKKSTKKIIDVIQIKNDKVIFGKNIFKKNNQTENRVILEYSSKASISLQYDEKNKRIVFDHLSPIEEEKKGLNQFYIPDGEYDSYNYKKNMWEYQKNINVKNKEKEPKRRKKRNEKGLFGS